MRIAEQPHPAVLDRSVSLLGVTGLTGSDDVLPVRMSAPGPGDDMIDGQPLAALAAVLTGEVIPAEDVPLAEGDLSPTRDAHESLKTDDARQGKGKTVGTDQKAILLHRLGPATENHCNGAASRANVERLIAPIQYQYPKRIEIRCCHVNQSGANSS